MEYVVANTAGSYAKHVGYLATAIAFEPKGHDYRLPMGKMGYDVHYLLHVVPAVDIGHCGLAVLLQMVVAAVGKALMVFVGVSYLVLEDVVGHGNGPCLETAYGAVGVELVNDVQQCFLQHVLEVVAVVAVVAGVCVEVFAQVGDIEVFLNAGGVVFHHWMPFACVCILLYKYNT